MQYTCFEATTASELTLTLVGREPSGVGGATPSQRRGGGQPAYRKGWAASAHTGDPPLLPSVTTRYYSINVILINIYYLHISE